MKRSESGSAGSTLVTVVLLVVAVGALAFGFWAYSGRQDYKNNADQKTAAAVAAAEAAQKTQLQAQFNQQLKSPYKTFVGSITYGSITFQYPNAWSSYVDTTNSSEPINGYYNPGDVPGTGSGSAFALRVELTGNGYNSVIQNFNSQVQSGTVTATAYVPPKMKSVANVQPGTLLTGAVSNSNGSPLNGAMLVIPVRDKTLQIYTLSNDYLSDFNNIVLASLTFVP
ncbi:MAG TPA: hypothetical protein VEH48_00715 [Candidatus Nitrosopolaris sp.]|nr:hypothetical protein [Candidatus Nitrosopolaris sp.]